MFRHQNKKKSVNNARSKSHQPRSTTRSSSLRLHLLHNTRLRSSQFSHKTKRRLWSTSWSRNQKNNKISSSQLRHQLNPANQRFTSSSTRPRRNQAVLEADTLQEALQADSHQAAVLISAVDSPMVASHRAAETSDQPHKTHNRHTAHPENKRPNLSPNARLVFLL